MARSNFHIICAGSNAAISSSARWYGTGTSIYSRSEAPSRWGVWMWALLQALAIAFVAAVLFVAVEKLEPNRLYAYLFMFLIIAVGTLAIVDQLLP